MGNPKDKNVIKEMPILPASNHVLASGESARYSGIYKLEHQSQPAHERETFIPKDTMLPFCKECALPLTFRLVRKMKSIAEDPDFQKIE